MPIELRGTPAGIGAGVVLDQPLHGLEVECPVIAVPESIRVRIEGHAPDAWAPGLERRGHVVETVEPYAYLAGHAHVIAIDDDGLRGAADPRAQVGSVGTP